VSGLKGADDYLAAGGTIAGLLAAASTSPPEVTQLDDEFTDARLAEHVADEVLADRYCAAGGLGWMEWNGVCWQRCDADIVRDAVRDYFLRAYGEAAREGVDRRRLTEMHKCLSAHRIRAVFALTRGIVTVDANRFDADPDLLNTPSGVVDLTTGGLLAHDPGLLMTKVTAADYAPGAKSQLWTDALGALPANQHEWYQRRMGQAATGYMPPDDVLLVCQGGGENGKTTLNGTIAHVLGDYAVPLSDRVLLADPSAHPTELMDLKGARLGLIEETPEARRLNVNRLKKTVGTQQITARYIARDSVTFTNTAAITISTNYRPVVEECDHGTWRRMLLVVFPYRFRKPHQAIDDPDRDRRGDPTLRQRLMSDADAQRAALAWIVEGAVRWYADGRVMPAPPDAVITATEEWRGESDLILSYVRDRVVLDAAAHVMAAELLGDFNAWLAARGHPAWSDRTFAARFESHSSLDSHRVVKKKVRRGTATSTLSRVEHAYPLPPTPSYAAWAGLRFATESDAVREFDEVEAAPNGTGSSSVPAVPADSDDSKTQLYREPPNPAGTAGTPQVIGTDWPRCACGELLLVAESVHTGRCDRCRTRARALTPR
jgi:putative DNA primase/helicase